MDDNYTCIETIRTSAGRLVIDDDGNCMVRTSLVSDCETQHILPISEMCCETSISHVYRATAKPPAIGDEVTMDGTTFEVSARKYVGAGAWMLTSDTDGQSHRWQG